MDIPETEPVRLVAGDSVKWRRTLRDRSADDGWSLTYYLIRQAAVSHKYEVAATGDGAEHTVEIAPDTTAAWIPGRYRWQMVAARTGERLTLAEGALEIVQGFATSPRATSGSTSARCSRLSRRFWMGARARTRWAT